MHTHTDNYIINDSCIHTVNWFMVKDQITDCHTLGKPDGETGGCKTSGTESDVITQNMLCRVCPLSIIIIFNDM